MASLVLSGSSNVSYTNNTGQNVRIVINFMKNVTAMSWANVSTTPFVARGYTFGVTIGRNLAFNTGAYVYATGASFSVTGNNMTTSEGMSSGIFSSYPDELINCSLPTELMIENGQTFSAICDVYNVVVIPEAG